MTNVKYFTCQDYRDKTIVIFLFIYFKSLLTFTLQYLIHIFVFTIELKRKKISHVFKYF